MLLKRANLSAVLLLLVLGSGCATKVVPPSNPVNPVMVYITDYGRHSSLVLPATNGGYVEWAFGDWNWFALGKTSWNYALLAVIWSPQSTLGRRVVPPQPSDCPYQLVRLVIIHGTPAKSTTRACDRRRARRL